MTTRTQSARQFLTQAREALSSPADLPAILWPHAKMTGFETLARRDLERAFRDLDLTDSHGFEAARLASLREAFPGAIVVDVSATTAPVHRPLDGITVEVLTAPPHRGHDGVHLADLTADDHCDLLLEAAAVPVIKITLAPDHHPGAPLILSSTGAAANLEIHVGARSTVTLIQLSSANAPVRLGLTHVHLHEHSLVHHVSVGAHAPHTVALEHLVAHVHHSASLHQFHSDTSGRVVRTRRDIHLLGGGASVHAKALLTVTDALEAHHYTHVTHHVQHTQSSQLTRGLGFGQGKGSDQSVVHIKPFAAQSQSTQSSRHLLLDDRAQIHARPILEIFNHDVKASHGATVGSLDPQMAFYLQSRGLSPQEAQLCLQRAFWHEALPAEPQAVLSEWFDHTLFIPLSAS